MRIPELDDAKRSHYISEWDLDTVFYWHLGLTPEFLRVQRGYDGWDDEMDNETRAVGWILAADNLAKEMDR